MSYERQAGILLHPTSLSGPDGIGDVGPAAYQWVDSIKKAGFSLWQVLPLGPTGYGDSPYQCFSAFAGNPYLVSPALLLEDGLLHTSDLSERPALPLNYVDYGAAIHWKNYLLHLAYSRFCRIHPPLMVDEFNEYQLAEKDWLEDFSVFMAIKEEMDGKAWNEWPKELRKRKTTALKSFTESHAEAIEYHQFRQFLFSRQWNQLHTYVSNSGIKIIGDIPLFVAYDSADVWANPDLFFLDKEGDPEFVAGVPPDYFSATGQLWGNPLYKWEYHRQTDYTWWIARIKSTLSLFDLIRLDHFRGFAGYWEIPAGMPTAEKGRWVPGPGADFLSRVQQVLGRLPIIAEDLGEITSDVIELRDKFNLPGMKIFQFSFASDPTDPFLPHNYPVNCVAYTGTHDNDTTIGWYHTAPESERDFCRRYLACDSSGIPWEMIRAVWQSVARIAVAPLQDFLSLDTSARMNFPGKLGGNWTWRTTGSGLSDELITRIREFNWLYNRLPELQGKTKKR
ncbi:MAG: 4-alpha-glucanotransferase [Leptolinea sp.]|jgi:4-alpha-glucanotransferase|nr:4-alpha-glucanotransferase [Leptolinea sp.]